MTCCNASIMPGSGPPTNGAEKGEDGRPGVEENLEGGAHRHPDHGVEADPVPDNQPCCRQHQPEGQPPGEALGQPVLGPASGQRHGQGVIDQADGCAQKDPQRPRRPARHPGQPGQRQACQSHPEQVPRLLAEQADLYSFPGCRPDFGDGGSSSRPSWGPALMPMAVETARNSWIRVVRLSATAATRPRTRPTGSVPHRASSHCPPRYPAYKRTAVRKTQEKPMVPYRVQSERPRFTGTALPTGLQGPPSGSSHTEANYSPRILPFQSPIRY